MIFMYVTCYLALAVFAYGPTRRAWDRLGHGIGFFGSDSLNAAEIERLAELSRAHSDVRKIAKKWLARNTKLRVRHLHHAEEIADTIIQRAEWLANAAIQKALVQTDLPGRERATAVLVASLAPTSARESY